MKTGHFVSTFRFHPLCNPFVKAATLVADERVQGWARGPQRFLRQATRFLVPALILAALVFSELRLFYAATLIWWLARPLRLLRPLAESDDDCKQALLLVNSWDACEAYRDLVLSQGRELLQADLSQLYELQWQEVSRRQRAERDTAAVEFGCDGGDPQHPAKLPCVRVHRVAWKVLILLAAFAASLFVAVMWDWRLVADQRILSLATVLANPVTLGCGSLFVWWTGTRLPVCLDTIHRNEAYAFLANPAAGQYLRSLRASGETVRRAHLRKAKRLAATRGGKACRELHGIDALPCPNTAK